MSADFSLPFAGLIPERILDAVESLGLRCDGALLALNSYENRVWQVGIDGGAPLVAKFYRPGRWSDAQIAEEHAFTAAMAADELPVVTPLHASMSSARARRSSCGKRWTSAASASDRATGCWPAA